MQDRDMLLVCFNHADMNNPHLTIGRREPGDKAELIRVAEGEEARELYFRLLGKSDAKQEAST